MFEVFEGFVVSGFLYHDLLQKHGKMLQMYWCPENQLSVVPVPGIRNMQAGRTADLLLRF